MLTTGRLHSFETFGTVDGPGIRFVIFLSGCNFRCLYCHNPDTWACDAGTLFTVQEVMEKIRRYLPYFKKTGGGVTVSGGEPLLQLDFLIELFTECKKEDIHTAVDTNGSPVIDDKVEKLLTLTDLVLLDIKHMDVTAHEKLTQASNENPILFAKYLHKAKIPTWLRYVVVPGITDAPKDILLLKKLLNSLSNIEKVELLPFHKLGEYKWKETGLDYLLSDIPEASDADILKVKHILGI